MYSPTNATDIGNKTNSLYEHLKKYLTKNSDSNFFFTLALNVK